MRWKEREVFLLLLLLHVLLLDNIHACRRDGCDADDDGVHRRRRRWAVDAHHALYDEQDLQ